MLYRLTPLLLAAFLFAATPVRAANSAAPVRVEARLESDAVLIGQPVVLVLKVEADPGVRVSPPVARSENKNFEILAVREPPKADSGSAREFRVSLSAFEVGDVQTPPLEIAYTTADGKAGTVEAPSLPLHVQSQIESLEKQGEKVALRDVKPPIRLPFRWAPVLRIAGIVVAALAVLLGLAWWVRRRMRGAQPAGPPPEPLAPPDEEALSELARIEMDDLARREAAKPFYSRLSYVLRRYMGRMWGFEALEATSSELTERASRLGWRGDTFRLLTDDLAEADSAKFARYSPSLSQRQAAIERVRRIVIDTRPKPTAPQAEESEDADRANV